MKRVISTVITLSVAATGACGSKDKDKGDKKEAKAEEKAVEKVVEPTAPAEPEVKVNPEVRTLIADIVANCKIDVANVYVSECKNGEADKIVPYVNDKQPEDFYVSLAEIALTDGAKDGKTLAAVLTAVSYVGWSTGKEWLAKNATPAAATRVLKLDEQLGDGQGYGFTAIGTAIPVLAGKTDALVAVITKRPPGTFTSGLVQQLATYAGAAALPHLEKIAKEHTDPGTRAAAVWSAGVALASPWSSAQASFALSDGDKAKVCDFAKAYLTDAESRVANSAASTMGRCKGAYIDAALTALEARAASEKFDDMLASALKDQCWAESSIDGVNGTVEQCTKDIAILESVTRRTDLEGWQLRSALWAMATVAKYGCGPGYGTGPGQSPECVQHARDVIAAFASSTEQSVADEVKRALADLGG